jgi:hypothetical protein
MGEGRYVDTPRGSKTRQSDNPPSDVSNFQEIILVSSVNYFQRINNPCYSTTCYRPRQLIPTFYYLSSSSVSPQCYCQLVQQCLEHALAVVRLAVSTILPQRTLLVSPQLALLQVVAPPLTVSFLRYRCPPPVQRLGCLV